MDAIKKAGPHETYREWVCHFDVVGTAAVEYTPSYCCIPTPPPVSFSVFQWRWKERMQNLEQSKLITEEEAKHSPWVNTTISTARAQICSCTSDHHQIALSSSKQKGTAQILSVRVHDFACYHTAASYTAKVTWMWFSILEQKYTITHILYKLH